MKNILIIRSCNLAVFHDLIENIEYNESDKIYCLVQENSAITFKNMYPDFILFIDKNNNFSYKSISKNINLFNKLSSIKFDEIYIPSSVTDFKNFEEIFKIVSKLKSNKYITFNVNCEKCDICLNYNKIWLLKCVEKISFILQIPVAITIILLIYIVMYPYTCICRYIEKYIFKR